MLPKLIGDKVVGIKEPKTAVLTLRMSENDKKLLDIISNQTGKTKTLLLNQALKHILDLEASDLGNKARNKLKGE